MDGSTLSLGPQAQKLGDEDVMICIECECEADELRDDLCSECFENSIDTSWASMRAEHGTW